MNGPHKVNGDRNALARSAFAAGLGTRKLGGILGADGRPLNGGNPYRVAIVVVSHGEQAHIDFAMAFANLCFNPGALLALVNQKLDPATGTPSMAYNNAIEASRPLNVDYFFFLSPDVVAPQHALRHLLARQLDVVGATVMDTDGQGMLVQVLEGEEAQPQEPVVEVGAIPPACLLVKAKVLDKLRRPYFRSQIVEEDLAAEPPRMPAIVPEWVGFCEQLRGAGVKVMLDLELSLQVMRCVGAKARITPPTEAEVIAANQGEERHAAAG